MHVDDEEAGDNIIVEEFQKGYMPWLAVKTWLMVKGENQTATTFSDRLQIGRMIRCTKAGGMNYE